RHSVGSGVIVDGTNGYILTNHHVVENATGIEITLFDNRVLQGTLVGGDEKTDMAVVRADIPDGILPHAVLGDSDVLEVGEWIVAVGNPFGLSHTVTAGIVSGRGRVLNRDNYEDFIQTDAAINPGNSGGPVINLDGHVVGISTAIASNNGYFQGAGFAIPINMARQIMGQLIRHGYVTRGYIGIRMATITTEEADELGIGKGVLIRKIERNTPAESAGLKARDVIVALQGEEVTESIQFRNKVASLSPGTSITLQIWRDQALEDIHLTLGALPTAIRPQKTAVRPANRTLGIEVESLNTTENEHIDKTGVLVSDVERGSEAFRFGIRAGDVILQVNNTPISSVAEYDRVMASVTSGEILMFLIRREMDNPRIISITKP
ncbi:MAG: trypsin-like peptidase domain-containing protein, partial [Gemmatimonadota bacterium]|nr:trypsin-like peptidase domain-containing protein [Gemmatimonadota bacterium]